MQKYQNIRTMKDWQTLTSAPEFKSRFWGAYQIGFGNSISDFEDSSVLKLHRRFHLAKQLLLQWSQYAMEHDTGFCYETLVPKSVLEALELDNDRLQASHQLAEGPLDSFLAPFLPMAAYCCVMHDDVCGMLNTPEASTNTRQLRMALEDFYGHCNIDEQVMKHLMAYFAPLRRAVREVLEIAIKEEATFTEVVSLHSILIKSRCYT